MSILLRDNPTPTLPKGVSNISNLVQTPLPPFGTYVILERSLNTLVQIATLLGLLYEFSSLEHIHFTQELNHILLFISIIT